MVKMAAIPGYLTTGEVAKLLGVDVSQVCRYINNDMLKAERVGRSWLVAENDAKSFERPPMGNPNLIKNN
jgi:excisionase family DNA binding protein